MALSQPVLVSTDGFALEFEDALRRLIPRNEPKRDLSSPIEDSVFDQIHKFLHVKGRLDWAKRPRTCAILSLIERLDSMDAFIQAGFSDNEFPYRQRDLLTLLPEQNYRERFLQLQSLALSKTGDLEDGNHKHFASPFDADSCFLIEKVLGAGKFGIVDHVVIKASCREYARKRVSRRALPRGQNATASFKAEIETLKCLNHPHITQFVGSYTDSEFMALLITPVAECDLKMLLANPSPEQHFILRNAFGCLAAAIHYLHDHNCRHKDIKPANILVKNTKVLLSDFGTAKNWPAGERGTTTGVPGPYTAPYAAPEVVEWEARNEAADVWSLGCVFLEMLTVLKGESINDMKIFFEKRGTGNLNPRANPQACGEWLTKLRQMGPMHDKPIQWIQLMLMKGPRQRVAAADLFSQIRSYQDLDHDLTYCDHCCRAGKGDLSRNASSASTSSTEAFSIFPNDLQISGSKCSSESLQYTVATSEGINSHLHLLPAERHERKVDTSKASKPCVHKPNDGLNTECDSHEYLFTVPFDRDDFFIGREDINSQVTQSLSQPAGRVALYGIGGVGKSQIAIEQCYRWHTAFPKSHILWINAGSLARFHASFLDIASRLNICRAACPMSEVLQSVSAWLTSQRSGKWLMVIDNADSEKLFGSSRDLNLFPGEQSTKSHIAPYLPRSSTGSILVTTRNKKVGIRVSGGCVVLVPTLGLSDGKAMLKRRLIKDVIWKDTKAEELLQLLEFLPLAISQAASYINEEDVDMNHYVNLLLNHKTRRSVLEANYYDPRRDHGTPNAVFLSWQVSFDEISVKAPRSAELLSHAVFLDRHSIPPLFLQQEDEDPVSFDRAVGTLKAYSFVKLGKHRGTLSIHPLIQACTHAWLAKQQSTLHWQESAMDMVFRRCPPSPNFDHWPAWHVIAPHIGQVLCYDTGTKSFSLQRASILASVAVYDRRQGRLELSIARARKALAIFQAYLGDEHPNTLDAMYALAMALKSDRSFPAAEILMRQVLEKRALLLGDHAHTTAAIQGLVRILAAQKKFTEAERLSRESLSRSESSLGLNHPDTLTAMNDLGMMLSKMKKYEESEDLFRRCFQRKLNTLGKNNRETLGAMGNLGSALSGQGKSKNAKKILEELVQQSEVALGEEDGDTILARNNLGIVLCQVGDYEDALFVFHRNEAMCRKVFGPQHLRTLECMKNTSACNSTQSRRS